MQQLKMLGVTIAIIEMVEKSLQVFQRLRAFATIIQSLKK